MRVPFGPILAAAFFVGLSGAALAQRRAPAPQPNAVQQPGTEQSGAFSPETYCRAPQKFAAGACVLQCPGGYEDRGRFCQLRSNS